MRHFLSPLNPLIGTPVKDVRMDRANAIQKFLDEKNLREIKVTKNITDKTPGERKLIEFATEFNISDETRRRWLGGLNRCPICARKPKLLQEPRHFHGPLTFAVHCATKECGPPTWHNSSEKAVAAWVAWTALAGQYRKFLE